jgi:DNA polymerase
MVVVGEQPGDREDRAGRPFVGPAGRLLDRALDQAGIDRSRIYMTNAVKHFKFGTASRGTRRLHKTPTRGEVLACRPWLMAELDALRPGLVLCLGATAAQSLLGTDFRVSRQRGVVFDFEADELAEPTQILATVHPSAVLRTREAQRREAYANLLIDLRKAAEVIA